MCSTAGRLHDSGLYSVFSFSLYRLLLSLALLRPRTGLRAHVRAHRCNLFTWAQLTGSINEPSWLINTAIHFLRSPRNLIHVWQPNAFGDGPNYFSYFQSRGYEAKRRDSCRRCSHLSKPVFIYFTCNMSRYVFEKIGWGCWEVKTGIHLTDTSGGRRRNALFCCRIIVIIIHFTQPFWTVSLKKKKNQRFLSYAFSWNKYLLHELAAFTISEP